MTVLAVLVWSGGIQARSDFGMVSRSDVEFQPLNPLRGDASPKAGVLWGDIGKQVATGTLIEFVDGFSSPPHIHNITYRVVVISGAVHNDDADAENMWMEPGSFWTQPAGETHITSARGEKTTAFLWGEPKDGKRNGTFLRLPAGYSGTLIGTGEWLKAVLIQGVITLQRSGSADRVELEPVSYFETHKQGAGHELSCEASRSCLI